MYIKKVKQTNHMDPCTLALETDKQMMEFYEKWDNESVEEFYDDVEKMNIQLDEFFLKSPPTPNLNLTLSLFTNLSISGILA